ncbi:CRISPR-associated protein Csx19 [Micromonospora sp. NBC_01405]|uniref:type III-D CRISPR-associated protein Csx19 n=1 Tax=Micromonospora sp. NBC_01405 TaxID=2903589 RepID=UPI0032465B25
MTTAPAGPALHAVRPAKPLTAVEAVAWFAPGTPPGRQVIGYTLSARAASWVRVHGDGTVEDVSGTGDTLAEAYEMVLFDGERELRWLRNPDGRGAAVALGEEPARLPGGEPAGATPPPQRGDTQLRLLAEEPRAHARAGWTTLHSDRYATAHLPWALTDDTRLAIEVVEYLVEDKHGNLDVADTRTVGLRPVTAEAAQFVTAATTGQEGTTV